jgi:hypothetical protein
VSAMDLKTNDPNKISPTAWIFVREVLGDKIGRKVFNTATLKKTPQPYWNELFQVDINDAECEILCVRVCSGSKFTTSSDKYFGEVQFPLRGSVRDYDAPDYQYKWYDLVNDNKEVLGKIKIFIQYTDSRMFAVHSRCRFA